LVISSIWSAWAGAAAHRSGSAPDSADADPKRPRRFALPAHSKKVLAQMFLCGALFSLVFVLPLVPWTIRNWRVFHVFQPLAPSHAEMPGEFVPRGYQLWVRSWIDDDSFISPFLWALDTDPIKIDDVPPYAYDSPEEKNRIAALLYKYNHPDSATADAENLSPPKPAAVPPPSPLASPTDKNVSPSPRQLPKNSNGEEDESENEESDQEAAEPEPHGPVEMTPEIDAGFAQIARARISRHWLQFYVLLPLKRARTMWFDTHSQYWPFEGALIPFDDLDYEGHQQYWLPLFAGLTALYTLLGLWGGWILFTAENFAARQWGLLVVLAIVLRLILFSSIENPEPRYLVEFFPLLSILGGIALSHVPTVFKRPKTDHHA